jgi:hypothetical protein
MTGAPMPQFLQIPLTVSNEVQVTIRFVETLLKFAQTKNQLTVHRYATIPGFQPCTFILSVIYFYVWRRVRWVAYSVARWLVSGLYAEDAFDTFRQTIG